MERRKGFKGAPNARDPLISVQKNKIDRLKDEEVRNETSSLSERK